PENLLKVSFNNDRRPMAFDKGRRFVVQVRNTAAQPLRFAVLSLGPDWRVNQVYPQVRNTDTLLSLDSQTVDWLGFDADDPIASSEMPLMATKRCDPPRRGLALPAELSVKILEWLCFNDLAAATQTSKQDMRVIVACCPCLGAIESP